MQRKISRTFQLVAVMPQGDLLARAGNDKTSLCERRERGTRGTGTGRYGGKLEMGLWKRVVAPDKCEETETSLKGVPSSSSKFWFQPDKIKFR